MLLDIITHPNKILRKKSRDIEIDRILDYQKLIQNMIETMLKKDGIGLAAPQVGKNIKLIVINKEVSGQDEHLILINPSITFYSKSKVIIEEGCLSLPKIFADVERPEKIRVKAYDVSGNKVKIKAKGMLSRVLQHEIDHLNGILFIDKIVNK